MKKPLPAFTLALLLAILPLCSFGQGAPPQLSPEPEQAQAAHLTAQLLTRYHYRAQRLDTRLADAIFNHYLQALDPQRLFFLQADIDELGARRQTLTSAMLQEDLSLPFAIFNRYAERATARYAAARKLVAAGFEFDRDESFQFARENQPWPQSDAEMAELWRKRVKNDWLRLKLAGQTKAQIVTLLDARYAHVQQELAQVKSVEAFETYMNAVTMSVDPHTNYMGPQSAEDFAISMRLSLVGIGASTTEKAGYLTISELTPGGPAALSGKIQPGDRIVGVAQGKGGNMVNVLGMRLEDVVPLLRGAENTLVVLDILPASAAADVVHKQVSLTRKKVDLSEAAAQKSIHKVEEGGRTRRIGVITLPSFYRDSADEASNPNFKSASRDVAALLLQLKAEKVDGVLLDLRNNGGGSLAEAIALTGLFTGPGPVVQQRDAQGAIVIDRPDGPQAGIAPVWGGPVAVLINRNSASASEIVAAAIQDYGRGVVIGERSFGKGTVQTTINLDEVVQNDKPQFGELKMTIAQFFRINGSSTQLLGVKPDISLSAQAAPDAWGEAKFDNALPSNRIAPANYTITQNLAPLLPTLSQRSEQRLASNPDFGYMKQDWREFTVKKSGNTISLNWQERSKERDSQLAKISSRKLGPGSIDDGLEPRERNLAMDQATKQQQTQDLMLQEAIQIVSDEAALLEQNHVVKLAPPQSGSKAASLQLFKRSERD